MTSDGVCIDARAMGFTTNRATASSATKNMAALAMVREVQPVADLILVGLRRFELLTSCTPCKRATRLRYNPKKVRRFTAPEVPRYRCFLPNLAEFTGRSLHEAQPKTTLKRFPQKAMKNFPFWKKNGGG